MKFEEEGVVKLSHEEMCEAWDYTKKKTHYLENVVWWRHPYLNDHVIVNDRALHWADEMEELYGGG